MIKVHGQDEFYDGWVSYILGDPRDHNKSEAFLAGYDHAVATPGLAVAYQISTCFRMKKKIVVEEIS